VPYIAKRRRDRFAPGLSLLREQVRACRESRGDFSFEAGDLAYIVYALLIESAGKPVRSFGEANAMLGAVRQAAREYERRHLRAYEDDKQHQNGDVE
jgi:hypothetical protein